MVVHVGELVMVHGSKTSVSYGRPMENGQSIGSHAIVSGVGWESAVDAVCIGAAERRRRVEVLTT